MAKKIDQKAAILDAMLDLVVKRGFHDAPMSALARRSGASPGVIYHYFPSKDELIRAVYERVAAVKHAAFFEGYSHGMSARDSLLHIWLNAYRFYRTHRKETRFLDQYLNSGYCKTSEDDAAESADPTVKRIMKWMRPKKHGGVLKDLPAEAIDSLTLGLAASLAKAPKEFPKETLKQIAETVWAAIAAD
jgi:TetR/AcrR family transcriptional regulator, repressor of fatR-cypB operon